MVRAACLYRITLLRHPPGGDADCVPGYAFNSLYELGPDQKSGAIAAQGVINIVDAKTAFAPPSRSQSNLAG